MPIGFNNVKKVPVTLQEGEIWVESDAGFGYKDSNLFGPVKAGSVQVESSIIREEKEIYFF